VLSYNCQSGAPLQVLKICGADDVMFRGRRGMACWYQKSEKATYAIQKNCRSEAQRAETPFAESQSHSGCGRKRKSRGECASSSCLSGVSAAQIRARCPFEGDERCRARSSLRGVNDWCCGGGPACLCETYHV
jgi:hypothetical protein